MGTDRNAAFRAAAKFAKPAAFDAEEEAILKEFKGLDLTDEDASDLADILRLRLGEKADRRKSWLLLKELRERFADLVLGQVTREHRDADRKAALDQFDLDESARRLRIEIALVRPATDDEIKALWRNLADLEVSHAARRKAVSDNIADLAIVTSMERGEGFRIHSRDGLGELYTRRKITHAMFEGGSSFRVRHEAASVGLRSALGEQGAMRTLTSDDMVEGKTTAAKWEIERTEVEQRVLQDCGSPALGLLRAVAGEGHSLSSQLPARTRSRRTFDQAVVLLGRSLLICGSLLPQISV